MLTTITEIFERDLNKLIKELELYPDENMIWKTEGDISNSAGTLALHLIGNLRYFIGATLGNTRFVRNREEEFLTSHIPTRQMVEDINDVTGLIKRTLSNLTEEDLKKQFPVAIGNKVSSTGYVLIHLLSHLDYHLGQINYHRRLIK